MPSKIEPCMVSFGCSSGPEISMCSQAVFGQDIDVISWDYGMTDGNFYTSLLHYFYRAGLNPGRPVIAALHVGGRNKGGRFDRMRELEAMGLAAFGHDADDDELHEMIEGVPDSIPLSDEDLAALPKYVRNFKCGDRIESGDPFCGSEKFNNWVCPNRRGKANWHPGW